MKCFSWDTEGAGRRGVTLQHCHAVSFSAFCAMNLVLGTSTPVSVMCEKSSAD
jgi:hypothetical protein